MTSNTLTRWMWPAALATGLAATFAVPTPARASDDLVQVIVDIADVVMRGDQPYDRRGRYGYDDRLRLSYDRYGRPVYYRTAPRSHGRHHPAPPRYAAERYRHHERARGRTECDRRGRCTTHYYDPREDRGRRGGWR
ncbi:hypothetical protein MNO14_02530 [Luteimonas sp. S4-F44]|uniref:hypothetical protein n=1 Tax=Luteimonas sp. S4-F44 TaxID=2925842 RepID=UPI001F53136A|nr:hypothetical protein [Luteimonas sp. S4-F44]UNK42997.1 hypothetical protein MNO14_02530 [Luteimonas sp. S4-F44]